MAAKNALSTLENLFIFITIIFCILLTGLKSVYAIKLLNL